MSQETAEKIARIFNCEVTEVSNGVYIIDQKPEWYDNAESFAKFCAEFEEFKRSEALAT